MVPDTFVGIRILREKVALQVIRERQAENFEEEPAAPFGFWNFEKKFAIRLDSEYQVACVAQDSRNYSGLAAQNPGYGFFHVEHVQLYDQTLRGIYGY